MPSYACVSTEFSKDETSRPTFQNTDGDVFGTYCARPGPEQ